MSALDKQVDGDHYKTQKIQPVEYIHANNLDFFEGNVVKYVTRWRNKNGLAARCRELPEEFYIPEPSQITTQSTDNKQMRTDEVHPKAEQFRRTMANHNATAFRHYKQMIADGCPRELARSVLPVSTYSHMFATMNLNNLFRFLAERLHPHAQHEIRVYAEAMLELIEPVVPVAVAAFKKKYGY